MLNGRPNFTSTYHFKAVVATFNQEKAFSVITNLRMELFEALDARRGVLECGVAVTTAVIAAPGTDVEHRSATCYNAGQGRGGGRHPACSGMLIKIRTHVLIS